MKNNKQDRAWELLDAIGEANEGFVADADADHHPKKRAAPILFLKKHLSSPRAVGVIAACLVLAIALPVFLALRPFGDDGTVTQPGEDSNSAVMEISKGESTPPETPESSGSEPSAPETSEPETSGSVTPPLRPVVASGSDLMAGIHASPVASQTADEDFLKAQMRFSLALFQQAAKGEKAEGNSLLLSPLSAQLALSMAANGAAGQTRDEMVSLLAGGLSLPRLNGYLHTLTERLTETGDGYKVNVANSIWYNDWVQVYEEFLQTNADYYGAGALRMPFDDAALEAINAWASEQTDGMIREALAEIDPEAAMYLLNTILFDAEWRGIYYEQDVGKGAFTACNGEAQQVSLMYSKEGTYYEDGSATGFAKLYKGGKYAFVALLPNEGVDVYDYVASLTPEGLLHTLQTGKHAEVMTALPKFSFAYESDLEKLLSAMGMESAFQPETADFSDMMTVEGYLESVNQKTVISVGELGTKAAAVTTVPGIPMTSEPNYEVLLNRPFVYMIVDRETNLPLFMGVQTSVDDSDVPEGEAPEIEDDWTYPEPEPPSYEGKDFTGLTVRLRDEVVTRATDHLQFLLENGSETDYEYMNNEVILQMLTEDGWETIPRIHQWEYLWRVAAGETFTEGFSLQNVFGIKLSSGETYRVVFPGVEWLTCEFTVTGAKNGIPEASEIAFRLDRKVRPELPGVVFILTNNSNVNFVFSSSDILLERKTDDGWETFSELEPSEIEYTIDSGKKGTVGFLPSEYGVEVQSGETYRVAFRNVPGLYLEFTVE